MHGRKLGIILAYSNTFINMISGLFLSIFLIRILGDTEYGIYQTIAAFANYLVIFEFGTGTVMTRNLSLCRSSENNNEIKKNTATIWNITLFLALLLLLISVLFYFFIDSIYANSLEPSQIVYGKKMFVFIAIYLIASFLTQTLNGIILAFEHYSVSTVVNIIRTLSKILILVVVISRIQYAIVIAVVDMMISCVAFVYTLLYCKRHFDISFSYRFFDRKILREACPLSLAIFLQTIVNQANNNVDKFVIGIKLSPEAVALYSVALFVFSIFSSLTTTPISMYGPQIIQNIGKGHSREQLMEVLIPPSRLIVLIGGTILFGFIVVGRQFITIAYGQDYVEAWLLAIILMVPMFFNMANGVLVNVLNGENKRLIRSVVLIFTTILNIILTVFWLDLWGIMGAAIATALTTCIGQLFVMNLYYSKGLKIPVLRLYQSAFKGILLFEMMSAAIAFVVACSIKNLYISFFAGGMTYVVVFGSCYYFFGANDTEKNMIKKVLGK